MKAKDIVILVCEKKSPAPHWTHTRGIYADLSGWPKTIDYYVKCPECGQVHGFYKSMADARSKRLCPSCDYDNVEKLKKDVAKLGEAKRPPKVPPPPEPEFDPDMPDDPKEEFNRLVTPDWVAHAKWELEKILGGVELIFDPDYYDNKDVDPDDLEAADRVTFSEDGSDVHYTIWRNDDIAEKEAIQTELDNFENEPSVYMSFLQNYVDKEKLIEVLTPDEETMTRESLEEEYSDYDSKVEYLVKEGELDESTFYDEEGNILEETPELERLMSDAFDSLITKLVEDRLSDPIEYLRDLGYGDEPERNPYTGQKGDSLGDFLERHNCIDYQKAAEEVVRADGWANTLARYDNKAIDLKSGAVAGRVD